MACARCEVAEVVAARMRGLLGRAGLEPGQGLLIPKTSSIHMFFMRFPIDAVFLDQELRVRKVVADLGPWKIAWARGSRSVLELPAGRGGTGRDRGWRPTRVASFRVMSGPARAAALAPMRPRARHDEPRARRGTRDQRCSRDSVLACARTRSLDLREQTRRELDGVVVGYDEPIDLLLVAAVAGGHVLLEGPPGIAKTLMAGAIARVLGVGFRRVQFTPDTTPEEITGRNVMRGGEAIFRAGRRVHEHPARRRDQPDTAAHAGVAARGDAGAARDGRGSNALAADARSW